MLLNRTETNCQRPVRSRPPRLPTDHILRLYVPAYGACGEYSIAKMDEAGLIACFLLVFQRLGCSYPGLFRFSPALLIQPYVQKARCSHLEPEYFEYTILLV
jgi:hypothetical protein